MAGQRRPFDHWVFQPLSAWVDSLPEAPHERKPRQRIQQGLNGFTARRCNEARGARGTFWQRESYDHWIRDVDELARIINYVEGNPVKAGLVTSADEWRYSSAYYRTLTGQVFGEPCVDRDAHRFVEYEDFAHQLVQHEGARIHARGMRVLGEVVDHPERVADVSCVLVSHEIRSNANSPSADTL